MNITICGSIKFEDEMAKVKAILEANGHTVKVPPTEWAVGEKVVRAKQFYDVRHTATAQDTEVWDLKERAMRTHFNKIVWSDAIVVVNPEKNGIPGYIGGNTLMELGLACHLHKPIYLLYEVPELAYKEEILGIKPILLAGELDGIPLVPPASSDIQAQA